MMDSENEEVTTIRPNTDTGIKGPHLSFLVNFDAHTKVINVDDTLNIIPKIKEVFKLDEDKTVLVKIFDQIWNCYVDVEDMKTLTNNAKLTVTLIETNLSTNTNQCHSTTTNVGPSISKFECLVTEEKLSESLLHVLKNGRYQDMKWVYYHEFINHVQTRLFQETPYPRQDELEIICEYLVAKYPALNDGIGKGYGALKQRLINRFKNSRRNSGDPEVQIKKRKKRADVTDQITVKDLNNIHSKGIVNWSSNNNHEDDFEKIRLMKEELQKSYGRDEEKLHGLMVDTFTARRRLVNSSIPVCDILEMYPALKLCEEMKLEFQHMIGHVVKPESVKEHFVKYGQSILNIICEKKKKNGIVQQMLVELPQLKATLTSSSYMEAVGETAIFALCDLLNNEVSSVVNQYPVTTDIDELTADIKNREPTPFIAAVGGLKDATIYYVIVERSIVISSAKLLEAIYYLFGTFYVFNLCYTKKSENFLNYVQHCILNIKATDSKIKVPSRVINLWSQIQSKI